MSQAASEKTENTEPSSYFRELLNQEAHLVAPKLLGAELVSRIGGHSVRVKIVEVEAYDQTDEASHSFKGPTERSKVMFGEAGHLYVYFTYGMHYCANIVTGTAGHGSGVLIRAVEPIEGIEVLEERRGLKGLKVTNGPGKLCQALGIDKLMAGHDLVKEPLQLILKAPLDPVAIVTSTRVGISRAKDTPWRFYIKGNPYVSKK